MGQSSKSVFAGRRESSPLETNPSRERKARKEKEKRKLREKSGKRLVRTTEGDAEIFEKTDLARKEKKESASKKLPPPKPLSVFRPTHPQTASNEVRDSGGEEILGTNEKGKEKRGKEKKKGGGGKMETCEIQ
jgi:hypothetical protein